MLGGGLKTKQKITGRLADALSELYLLSCVLKRYEDDGKPGERPPHRGALRRQRPVPLPGGAARRRRQLPRRAGALADARRRVPVRRPLQAGARLARPQGVELVLEPGEVRDRLTRYIYVSHDPNDPTGLLEVTLAKVVAAEEAEKKLDRAMRAGTGAPLHGIDWIGDAVKKGVLTESEGAAAARGRSADRPRHRRRPLRSGRGEAALHDAGSQRAVQSAAAE